MKTTTININEIIEIPLFKEFYEPQSNDDLIQSYKQNGQLVPLYVNKRMELINGYRMKDAIKQAGGTTATVIIMDGEPNIFTRIQLNMTREKSIADRIKEVKEVFKKFPKRMGKKNPDGSKYNRSENIERCLGSRWKGHNVITKLEFILNNDVEGDTLSKGIIGQNWKIDTCHQLLKEFQPVDLKMNYGFTKKLNSGLIGIDDTIKLIKQKMDLESYKDTLIIPEKVKSYNINCLELSKIEEHKHTVDLLLTSPPYFILRKYEGGDPFQIGHEKTKEEYCENVTRVIRELVVTLKESGNVMINIGETYDNGVGYGIPQLLKHYIETYTTLIYKDTLIWSKPNPKPQNETILRPINNVEYILWFVVDPKKSKYNLLKYTVEGRDTGVSHGCKDVDKNGIVWNKNVSITKPYKKIYSHIKEQDVLNIIECSVGKNHDVYKIYKEGHPAIMSGLLPVIPVLMTTDEDDIVLDPFSGSNIVGRISLLLNRRVLSTELSKEYFKIGCRMLENSIQEFDRNSLDIIKEEAYLKEDSDFNEISIAA